jgi:hypothetical protein
MITIIIIPRDMVCLRNISVDTLHKGDTEDNKNNIITIRWVFRKWDVRVWTRWS